jgi:hypothetical protein
VPVHPEAVLSGGAMKFAMRLEVETQLATETDPMDWEMPFPGVSVEM